MTAGVSQNCPSYLGEVGQQAWVGIREIAGNAGIIDDAGFALELAAATYEEYRQFRAEVEKCDADTGSKAAREICYEAMTEAWGRCCSSLSLFAIRPPSRVEPWRDPLRGILPDVS